MSEPTQNAAVIFGDFVRTHRVANGITGRDASFSADILPSNFSKLEHGVLLPPRDGEKQRKLAAAIGLKPDSVEMTQFFDLAAKATEATPIDLAEIISKNETVPLLLRTIGNKRLSEEEIARIVEIVHAKA